MPGGLVEAVAVHVLDDDLVRQPDSECEAAADREVSGQRLLGEHCRVPRIRRHDRRAEFDVGHLAAGDRERGQRLQAEDVRHPGRGEPVINRNAQLVGHVDERVRAAGLSYRGADSHNNLRPV